MTKSIKFALTTHANLLKLLFGKVDHSKMVEYKNTLISDAFKLGKDITKDAEKALFQVESKINISIS